MLKILDWTHVEMSVSVLRQFFYIIKSWGIKEIWFIKQQQSKFSLSIILGWKIDADTTNYNQIIVIAIVR